MFESDERIEDAKPTADRAEQERPESEEPDDPERAATPTLPPETDDADAVDVAVQLREVPFDDDDDRLAP